MVQLKEKAKQLPQRPGVYIMKDFLGDIVYVGKAKSLRNRVSQYFQNSSRHAPKIVRMIEGIRDFDFLLADTELEALLLESKLIKDLKPIYNSQLKNPQKYCYIYIDTAETYPTIRMSPDKDREGLYFGPYTSARNVERALEVLKENIKIRDCSSFTEKQSGCLKSQLGFCTAPCAGEITEEHYRQLIDQVIGFLKGERSDIIKNIECRMLEEAEVLNFDKAAKLRDDASALGHLISKGETIRFAAKNRCIAALERISADSIKLFLLRGNHIVYKEKLDYKGNEKVIATHMLDLIRSNIGELRRNETTGASKLDIDQAQIIYSYLKTKKQCSYLILPQSWLKKDFDKVEQGIKVLVEKLNQK